jgi:hypothetical protein
MALAGLFGLAPLLSAGCSGDGASFCAAVCECQGCSERETEECNDDVDDAERLADHDGCAEAYAAYVSCYVSEGTCEDGAWRAASCIERGSALRSCSGRAATFVKTACEEERDKFTSCGMSGGGGGSSCSTFEECRALCALAVSCEELVNQPPGGAYVSCTIACSNAAP